MNTTKQDINKLLGLLCAYASVTYFRVIGQWRMEVIDPLRNKTVDCKEMNEWPFGLQTFRDIPVKTAAAAVEKSATVWDRLTSDLISFVARSRNATGMKLPLNLLYAVTLKLKF